jgi:trk system potassium uptake protein TrkA
MKKFIVIGLGNFGMTIAKTLMDNNCEVLGIDPDRDTVQKAKDIITHAVMGDASNRTTLDALSLDDFNCAIVSIGQDLAPSILIALHLKEAGMNRIVARAVSEDHVKILKMIGVSDIIFPERDSAVRTGKMLSMKSALDYLPLVDDYAILEVNSPRSFIGKPLRDLKIGSRFGCQVLGIKENAGATNIIGPDDPGKIKIAPIADDIVPENSVLIVLGRIYDIERMQTED